MDKKLFTAIEIAVIAGLIIFVLYLGGVFKSAPTTTPLPAAKPTLESTSDTARTPTQAPITPTPTVPPLTTPSGLIAFNSTRTGDTELFVVNADGTQLRNLSNNKAEDYVLEWSPDGRRLAFFSTRTGWLELYLVEIESGAITQLTDTQSSDTAYSYPISWSPDGRYILSGRANPWIIGGITRRIELELIQTDGSGAQTIFALDDQYPTFWNATLSPDGMYVAYIAQSDEGYGVHTAQIASEGLMAPHLVSQLCKNNFFWKPKSHRVTCAGGRTLFTLPAEGGEKESVCCEGEQDSVANLFSWSPNGEWILALYLYYRDQVNSNEQTFRVVSAVDKSQFKVVSDDAIDAETTAGFSWSGDSQWIAYTSHRFGPRDIFITNIFDPDNVRQIAATTLGENYNPRWQP